MYFYHRFPPTTLCTTRVDSSKLVLSVRFMPGDMAHTIFDQK
jgi:hypothetical protein